MQLWEISARSAANVTVLIEINRIVTYHQADLFIGEGKLNLAFYILYRINKRSKCYLMKHLNCFHYVHFNDYLTKYRFSEILFKI